MCNVIGFESLPFDVIQQFFAIDYFNSDHSKLKEAIISMAQVSKKIQGFMKDYLEKELLKKKNAFKSLTKEVKEIEKSFSDRITQGGFFIPSTEEEQKLLSDFYKVKEEVKKWDKTLKEIPFLFDEDSQPLNDKNTQNLNNPYFFETFSCYKKVRKQLQELNLVSTKTQLIYQRICAFKPSNAA